VNIRRAFLSAPRVRDAYLGYAMSQFGRLVNRGDGSFSSDTRKRTEKHARHLVRLVEQGFLLYTTGELVVDLRSSWSEVDPIFVREAGKKIAEDPRIGAEYMVKAKARFDAATTVLPERPDEERVEKWLIKVRRAFLSKE
jgi:hypothetical protein